MDTFDKEIEQLEREDVTIKNLTDTYIRDFIDDIKRIDKSVISDSYSLPLKRKIPFKVKVKRFFERLNKTLG